MGIKIIFTKLFTALFRSIATFSLLIILFVVSWSAYASTSYFDDSGTSDIYKLVFQDGGCAGCHDLGSATSCANTASQTNYLGNTTTLAGYPKVAACYTRIYGKLSSSTNDYTLGGHTPGVEMPYLLPTTNNSTYQGYLSTWSSKGMPFAPPVATTSTGTATGKTTATLNGTFNSNVISGTSIGGTYSFEYGLSTSYTNTSSAFAITGTSVSSNKAIGVSGLSCGKTYHFRAKATNGGGTGYGSDNSFSTTACTPPAITGTFTVNMSEDDNPTAFAAPSLSVTAGEAGTKNWARSAQGSLGSATVSGSGSSPTISYTVNANANGTDFFTVRVTNATTGLFDDQIITVNIAAINDKPVVSGFTAAPAFIEQTPQFVDTSITIGDVDASSLNQATVEITNVKAFDSLVCPSGLPVGVSCTPGSTLTISGSDTWANYQTYIGGVKFNNTSDTPDTTTRLIRLIVRDTGTGTPANQSSDPVTLSMSVTAVNDPPTAVSDSAPLLSVGEGGLLDTSGIFDLRTNDSDPETVNTSLTATQSLGTCSGTGPANATGGGFTLRANGSFSYQHDSSNTTSDSFTYCVYDGDKTSGLATVSIIITAVNDLPIVTNFGGTTPFTEQTPVVVDGSINISDSDISPQVQLAQMRITNDKAGDSLACTNVPLNTITSCTYSANLLTISGLASLTDYETVLQAVQFNNTEDQPDQTIRNVSLTVLDDLGGSSVLVNKSITITRVNDAPTAVDDGSSVSGFVTLAEGAIVDTQGVVDLRSNDSDPETAKTALITTQSASCVGGAGSPPANAAAFTLRTDGSFTYDHNSSNTTTDSFTYCVSDGSLFSTLKTVYIDITPVNDPPQISAFGGSIGFTEQTAVVVNGGVQFTDSESANLAGATLQISGNYVNGEDSLACAGSLPSGISACIFTAGSATLTLSGVASLASYQAAVDGVQFNSSSDNPATAAKTISLAVTDESGGVMSTTATKNLTPIVRVNDPPTLAAISPPLIDASNHAYENTTADPYTFTYTAVASDLDVDDDNNTGNGSLTYSLSGAPAGMSISNAAANPGKISWSPPKTGTFGQVYGPITVTIEDGNEDASTPDSKSFSVTVSPPDVDLDGVPNYDDLCLTVADASNADNDDDGTAGSDGGANDGGDVCDLDDDNDGMPDSYEIANALDPFDAADKDADADNDGISNYDEFLAGTNPNFVNITIDASGYLTPFALTPPLPTFIHSLATAVSPSDSGPYRPGRHVITWTAANGTNANLGTQDQTLDVRPLANFSANQQVVEGSTVNVIVSLNGSPPVYPATVNYSVSGTADNPDDHDAATGSLTFNSSELAKTITFNVTADNLLEGNETVVFNLESATNAAIGSKKTQEITIVEGNVAPVIKLSISQSGVNLGKAFVSEGLVTVEATVTDANSEQTHTLDWSATNNSLVAPTDSGTASWTFTPVAGHFLIDVNVTDSGNPALSNRVSRVLNIAATAPVLAAVDSDGDGINDDVEGIGDGDSDGVPDYLDANDGTSGEANLIANQTVDFSTSYLVETEPGLTLSLGNTALAANKFGALVTDSDISNFGSLTGDKPLGANDDFEHIGGVYDFEVTGMVPAAIVSVVIPLQSSIPLDATYRKFHADRGWVEFVVDDSNHLASASAELGACPEPGSELYESGLNYLYHCLQLSIEDGGPNDTDGIANGVIKDPGSVGIKLSDPSNPEVKGGGQLNPLMLLWLLSLLVFQYLSRYPLRDKNH